MGFTKFVFLRCHTVRANLVPPLSYRSPNGAECIPLGERFSVISPARGLFVISPVRGFYCSLRASRAPTARSSRTGFDFHRTAHLREILLRPCIGRTNKKHAILVPSEPNRNKIPSRRSNSDDVIPFRLGMTALGMTTLGMTAEAQGLPLLGGRPHPSRLCCDTCLTRVEPRVRSPFARQMRSLTAKRRPQHTVLMCEKCVLRPKGEGKVSTAWSPPHPLHPLPWRGLMRRSTPMEGAIRKQIS